MQKTRLIFLLSQNDIGGNTKFVVNLAKEFTSRGVECEIYVPYFTHYYYTKKFRTNKNLSDLVLWAKYVIFQLYTLIFVSKFDWRGNMFSIEKLQVKRYIFSPSKKVLTNSDFIITSAHWDINQMIELGIDLRRVIHVIHHLHSDQSSDLRIFLNKHLFSLVVSSAATGEKCRKIGIRGFTVCNLGVDIKIFHPNRKIRKDPGNLRVGFFYYNHPRKNPLLIQSVIKKLIDNYPKLGIYVFGNGFKISDRGILINKNLSELELAEKLSSLDLFIYISRIEGFGLPPLEAMACGVPVIASNVGAINKFVKHNENGLIIKDGASSDEIVETIFETINDPIKLKKLSRNAFMASQNWTWSKTCDSYIKLFEIIRKSII